jgi:hypothetical protein
MSNKWQGVIGDGAGGIDAAYDPANKAIGVVEQNPQPIQLPETVVEATNVADGTYDYYIDLENFRSGELQVDIVPGTSTVTVTVEKSIQNDGTAAASASYQDISQYGVAVETQGATAVGYTADVIINLGNFAGSKFLHIKVVVSGGGNDGNFDIYSGLSS